MTDLPPGDWSGLLVGHQWPHATSLAVLRSAAVQRSSSGEILDSYADALRSIRLGSLASQEGATADSNRAMFIYGEDHSRNIAGKHRIKVRAYNAAIESVESLRDSLSEIAANGNRAIEEIRESNAPNSVKLPEIVRIISQAQSDSNIKSALCAADIFSATESVLAGEGSTASARGLAAAQGLNIGGPGALTDVGAIQREVSTKLASFPSFPDAPANDGSGGFGESTFATAASGPSNQQEQSPHSPEYPVPAAPLSDGGKGLGPGSRTPLSSLVDTTTVVNTTTVVDTTTHQQSPPLDPGSVTNAGSAAASNGPSLQTSATSSKTSPDSTGVQEVSESVKNPVGESLLSGHHGVGPISAGVEAITSATGSLPISSESPMVNGSITENPTDTDLASRTVSEHGAVPSTSLIAPVAPPAVAHGLGPPPLTAPAPPATPAPPGPLLAYGTDLRPPVATALPTAPITTAAPGSAPVNPTGGTGPTGQSAVLRQHSPSLNTAHAPSAAGLTERAFAANATGSTAASTTARVATTTHLRRILHAVANQQPQLRWAVGDLEDGTTVLVTDLSCGWVPPHIDIPVGVHLLKPGLRRDGLHALLATATRAVFFEPGQRLAPEPVPMSALARETDDVDELGWELSQATKWRDGLPRLAHTLARSACAGTGYLDSELALLRDHLRATAGSILDTYPDRVDPEQVANWQLLATIDALASGQKSCANYHFAWFRAQTPTRELDR